MIQAESNSTALAPSSRVDIDTLPSGPRDFLAGMNLVEIRSACEWIAKSGLVPKDYTNQPDKCAVAMMHGAELGLAPMQSLQSIAVVNGKPSVYGAVVGALCRRHPAYLSTELEDNFDEESDPKKWWASCRMLRATPNGGVEGEVYRYSMEDAARAGLTGKDNWKNYPKMMLHNRARMWAARQTFPECLNGLPVYEELAEVVKSVEVLDTHDEPTEPAKGSAGLAKTLGVNADEEAAPVDASREFVLASLREAVKETRGLTSGKVIKWIVETYGLADVKSVDDVDTEELSAAYEAIVEGRIG